MPDPWGLMIQFDEHQHMFQLWVEALETTNQKFTVPLVKIDGNVKSLPPNETVSSEEIARGWIYNHLIRPYFLAGGGIGG